MPLSESELSKQLQSLLDEAFDNEKMEWTYFTAPSPTGGLLGAIGSVSAVQACLAPLKKSLAAEVSHIAFAMRVAATLLKGGETADDAETWRASWRTPRLDDPAWIDLQRMLRSEYQSLRQAIGDHATDTHEAFGHASGVVAHVAYHLGSIKQKLAALEAT